MKINRRGFIGCAGAGVIAQSLPAAVSAKPKGRNPRPYSGLDWSNVSLVRTTTHGHAKNQEMLDKYLKRGFDFLTISNYYPSAPTYPGKKMRNDRYRVRQDFPVMFKGKRTDGPFEWNKIVDEWKDELPEEQRRQLPFSSTRPLFKSWPEGILEAPNAEHHSFVGSPTHMCSVGSTFSSGTFDARNRFKTVDHGYKLGSAEPWKKAIDRMLEGLIYPDGGGVTVNHPRWSRLKQEHLHEILDYDPRVFGIEVYNYSGGNKESYPWSDYWSIDYWDRVLASGRQCFGVSVPDWAPARGVNVLVVPERTVHACLKAYREGNFYGAVFGNIVEFTGIAFDGRTFSASTDKPVRFELVSKKGVIATGEGTKFSWRLPSGSEAEHGYLRLVAKIDSNPDELLFTQAQMLCV